MKAASLDRMSFGATLMEWIGAHPEYLSKMVFILGKSLGKAWDSAALAAFWGIMMTAPKDFRKNALRLGFENGFDLGDRIFQAVLDNPQGLWLGKMDEENNLALIKTPSGKIELVVPELADVSEKLNAENEERDLTLPSKYPLILNAGRHRSTNINTLMRNHEWIKGKRGCTIAVNPKDAESLGLKDGDNSRVTTEAGTAVGELEVSDDVREGTVLIPHGFGLNVNGETNGINVNHLTKNTNRDIIGSPMHRFVPCSLEAC
jgi:anaerobic selenocysteine-containing dehydrogenase